MGKRVFESKMDISEEIYCYHCEKLFYLKGFRLTEAKTVSCLYCKKRIDKAKSMIKLNPRGE